MGCPQIRLQNFWKNLRTFGNLKRWWGDLNETFPNRSNTGQQSTYLSLANKIGIYSFKRSGPGEKLKKCTLKNTTR